MSIEPRGGQWYYRFKVKGVEYRRPTGLAATKQNESKARSAEAKAKLEVLAEIAPERPAEMPFSTAADQFLRWCFSTEYRRKPNTARRIKTSFASLLYFFGDMRVSDITPKDIEDYKTFRYETHGVRDITLRHDLHALSVFFHKFAMKAKWAKSNPVDDVTKPSDQDTEPIHALTHEEEAAYFDVAARSRNLYDVARLMLLTGCRPEEIMSLKQSAVDLKARQIHISAGKTKAATRTLDLPGEAYEILRRRLEDRNTWVFPSERHPGRYLTKLNGVHDRACRDAGVSFRLYDLRHTFATRQITEVKTDPKTLAVLMGHSTVTVVLKHYVHPDKTALKKAMQDYEKTLKPRLKRVV